MYREGVTRELTCERSRATREYNADDGAPKAKKTWVSKKSDKYVDRAAARRQGLDNEFTEVIAVRDEFERRQEGDDAADVEAKRQLLGGDAEHSILVKGQSLSSDPPVCDGR